MDHLGPLWSIVDFLSDFVIKLPRWNTIMVIQKHKNFVQTVVVANGNCCCCCKWELLFLQMGIVLLLLFSKHARPLFNIVFVVT